MAENRKILSAATYAEPETEYLETEVTVAAEHIQEGDRRNGREVSEIKTGSKWTYLKDAEGKTIEELQNGSLVPIVRLEPSAESAAAQYRARVNRSIADKLANRHGELKAAQARVNAELDRDSSVDAETLARLMTIQAELRVLNGLVDAAGRAEDGEDLVDVQREYADHLANRLVRESRRGLSRSTSMLSNLAEDCDRAAMAEFVERVRWAL